MLLQQTFRPLLTRGLSYSYGSKGGRRAFDPVAMFKVLVVQMKHNLLDVRMEFIIRDRLIWRPKKAGYVWTTMMIHCWCAITEVSHGSQVPFQFERSP